jgi:NADH:ubiquinone oxidoreductase subunit H
LGAIRSAAQMVSYEVSIGLILMNLLIVVGSLNIREIVDFQANVWFVVPFSPLFILFFISALAETNRAPFDLPEAEGELVAGFNVEYSSTPFALFFIGEYVNILFMAVLSSLLFFGGGALPFNISLFFPPIFVYNYITFSIFELDAVIGEYTLWEIATACQVRRRELMLPCEHNESYRIFYDWVVSFLHYATHENWFYCFLYYDAQYYLSLDYKRIPLYTQDDNFDVYFPHEPLHIFLRRTQTVYLWFRNFMIIYKLAEVLISEHVELIIENLTSFNWNDFFIRNPHLVFAIKICLNLFAFLWVRASLPRYRYDQLMRLTWKVFLPLSLGMLVFTNGVLLFINSLPA